ncbi:MAG: inorganic phosphate transporter, partial [Acidobacteria bacterium]|nr:inorganic phosphate transporter [Acidobacteriota bacterium]
AIIGSLAGVGAVAYGLAGMNWQAIAGKIVLPLLLTPLASMLASAVLLRSVRFVAGRRNIPECICAEIIPAPVLAGIGGASSTSAHWVTSIAPQVNVTMGSVKQCAVHAPQSARLTMNHLHWLTSGATSFARGLNDAPKIVALALAAAVLAGAGELLQPAVFALITLAMVAGSVVYGLRVTRVLAERVTPMDHHEGFFANLVTSLLVGTGAVLGLPMSTTHVATGAIIGIGVANGGASVNRNTVRDMLLAWVMTLPAAALLGIAAYGMARIIA